MWNVIFHLCCLLGDFRKCTYIKKFWKSQGILLIISCPQLAVFLLCTLLFHFILWEWLRRDNGTISSYAKPENSSQPRTCFSTGDGEAACHLHIPASQLLSASRSPFIVFSILIFISAREATRAPLLSITFAVRICTVDSNTGSLYHWCAESTDSRSGTDINMKWGGVMQPLQGTM